MEQENKRSKVPFILGGFVIFGAISLAAYIWYRTQEPDFPVLTYSLVVAGLAVFLALFGFILYKLLSAKKRVDRSESASSPKEFVSTTRALQIWKEELMEWNQMPWYTPNPTKNPDEKQPCDPNDIEFRNTVKYVDPSGQTSDQFMNFEVIVRNGKNTGMLVAAVNLDLGEKYLRENWNQRMKWNTHLASHNNEVKKYPLTSSKSYQERAAIKALELGEEGYSKSEIQEIFDPLIQSQRSTAAPEAQTSTKKKRPAIRAPEVNDFYNSSDDEEEYDEEDLQEDIESYRRGRS